MWSVIIINISAKWESVTFNISVDFSKLISSLSAVHTILLPQVFTYLSRLKVQIGNLRYVYKELDCENNIGRILYLTLAGLISSWDI